jgi:Txe/YoeB family toxin of Txe-Axe toxin-antitoxin module
MASFEHVIYKQLIQRHPDFHSLRSYLESDEGGLFRIVDHDIANDLCIIRYEKGVSNMELPHSKWFRSVVWNTRMNRPVSIAPPKSASEPFPYVTCAEAVQHGMRCEEQLDGVMINCFRVAGNEQLYISTRSSLYAAGHFYSPKSFRLLFMEAYLGTDKKEEMEERMQKDTMMFKPDAVKDEYATYYSFLLQHKEHRIVKKIEYNYITLLQCGTVYQDGRVVVDERDCTHHITFPIPTTQQSIHEWFLQTFGQQPYDFQGVVFKDGSGNRWRMRTEKYKMVKSLRGNQAGDMERYAQLFVQNLQYTYLDYYPEDAMSFALQSACITSIIDYVYRAYVAMHIIKDKSTAEMLEQIDKMYHPHLYALHGIYLTQLRPAGKKMSMDTIRNYFHKQPWQRIAFLLRKTQDAYLSMIHSAMADS